MGISPKFMTRVTDGSALLPSPLPRLVCVSFLAVISLAPIETGVGRGGLVLSEENVSRSINSSHGCERTCLTGGNTECSCCSIIDTYIDTTPTHIQ
jgi:hypothetical protein